MLIAGIAEGRDAAAALIAIDGGETSVLAVVYQQSVDRVAHSAAFPSAALDACLDVAGRKARDLDRIVVTNLPAVPAVAGASPTLARASGSRRLAGLFRRTGVYRVAHDRAAARVEDWAKAAGFRATVSTVETDLAHAHLAYRTAAHGRAIIIVGGQHPDGHAISVFEARNGQIDPLPETGRSSLAEVLRAQPAGEHLVLAGEAFASFGRDRLGLHTTLAPLLNNGGAALGAALWEAGPSPSPLLTRLLGPEFTSDAAYKALSNTQQPRDKADPGEVIEAAVGALTAGHSVFWARGRAGSRPDLLPGRAELVQTAALPSGTGQALRLVVGEPEHGLDLSAESPDLVALLLRTGPLYARPIARPGEPAALSPTDVIRVFRAAGADRRGQNAPALLVLGDYLVRAAALS